jgi:hypothetical protein
MTSIKGGGCRDIFFEFINLTELQLKKQGIQVKYLLFVLSEIESNGKFIAG